MRRLPMGTAVGLGAAAVLVSGCGADNGVQIDTAGCADTGRVDNPVLVLLAQAVPTAQLVPCIGSVPAGWAESRLRVRDGSARFALGSEAKNPNDLTVTLSRSCRIAGATQVPSDVAGARRFERPRRLSPGYAGERYYVYPGGCTTYRFDIAAGEVRAAVIGEAADAVRFVPRAAVADLVRRMNDGRVPLDPTTRSRT